MEETLAGMKSSPATQDAALVPAFQRAGELLEVGMSVGAIATVLRKEKYDAEVVARVVQTLTNTDQALMTRSSARLAGGRELVRAALYTGSGIVLSSVNHALSGPTFLFGVAWLAILYGVVRLLKGLRSIVF